MGKIRLFTPEQQDILDQVKKSSLASRFYFTGGTALSAFYLHHRLSDDLDFFSTQKFSNEEILSFVHQWSNTLDFTFSNQWREVVYIFILKYKSGYTLKVDFGYYPYKPVGKQQQIDGFTVDSLFDIAVNKLAAINQRRTAKDYVDLYYLLQEFTIWDLIDGVKTKFKMKIEPWILASDLIYDVKKLKTMPKMIKPLTLDEVKNYFHDLAKDLGGKSII